MFILNVDAFNAATWISERWNVVSEVQVERSENRRGLTKRVYSRVRQIPTPERDKPNLQAIVTSPGWRDMALSARVVAMTLLAVARMDANNSVTISRKGVSELTGITDPSTLARANREVQAIGLFEIDRGYKTKYAQQPTVYRLTWWSQVFQRWLKAGYAVPEVATLPVLPSHPSQPHQGTSKSGGITIPAVPAEEPSPGAPTTSRMPKSQLIQIVPADGKGGINHESGYENVY
jgi:hypothetical protein